MWNLEKKKDNESIMRTVIEKEGGQRKGMGG
jgi:hypothetical protein